MLNAVWTQRNTERLEGQHPSLVAAVTVVLDVMDRLGHPMVVTDGVRTLVQQQALYAQGRTTPGKIVTYANGVARPIGTGKSNHQVWADGFGHAVDCTFVVDLDADGDMDDPTWDERRPWRLYGEVAKSQGLKWGGDWTRPDKPHVELL